MSAEDVAVAEKRWGRTGVLNKALRLKAKGVAEVELLEEIVSYREGLSRLDFRRRCSRSRTKVVCREGDRRRRDVVVIPRAVKTLHAQHAQRTRASGVSRRTQLLENVRGVYQREVRARSQRGSVSAIYLEVQAGRI
jgi:hypothetical protein